ncbi:DUF7848 domain-containing protein [Streptomyces sp. NPDC001635]
MTPTNRYAYPEVRTDLDLDNLPSHRWVECASCVASKGIEHVGEAHAWAKEHHRRNPQHDRFRVVRQKGWRIVPPTDTP